MGPSSQGELHQKRSPILAQRLSAGDRPTAPIRLDQRNGDLDDQVNLEIRVFGDAREIGERFALRDRPQPNRCLLL